MFSEVLKALLKGDYKTAGDIYRRKGNLEKALKMYLLAEDYISAAEVESYLGRPEKAIEHLLRVGEIDAAVRLLVLRKNYKKASEILANANRFLEAAKVAEEGNLYQIAADYYDKAGRFFEAGIMAYKGGVLSKALLLLNKSLKEFPLEESIPKSEQFKWRERKKEIARIFEEGGVYDKAAELYESLNLWEASARCMELAGEIEKAVAIYEKLGMDDKVEHLLGKEKREKLLKEAYELEKLNKLEEAEQIYEKLNSKRDLARVKELLGKYVEAGFIYKDLREMEKAAHLFYKGGEFLEAGNTLYSVGEYELAIEAYVAGGFYFEASICALEAQKYEEAVNLVLKKREMIDEIIYRFATLPQEKKNEPLVKISLARLKVETGNFTEALKLVKEIEGDPYFALNPWPDYLKGRISEALCKYKEAINFYSKVVRKNYAFEDAQKRLMILVEKTPKTHLRYEGEEVIYEGILGKWLKTKDKVLNIEILVFKLNQNIFREEELKETIYNLKKALSLSHSNILTLKDIDSSFMDITLIFESFKGLPLILGNEQKRFSVFLAIDIIRQILEALYESHQSGFLHKQLLPEFVLFNEERKVKVSGFGLSYPSKLPASERKRYFLYLAPEVRRGSTLTPSADLYSVGALLYFLLFKEEPPIEGFEGIKKENLEKLKEMPPQVEKFLKGLFSSSLVERFKDVSEALQELKPLEFLEGAIIAQRYEIIKLLGKGGMGEVYKVKDLDLNEIVAMKMMRVTSGMSENARARFLREIKITRKLTHPNIIKVFDYGTHKDITFVTMEYIEGPSLYAWVKENVDKNIPISVKISILKKIAKGLENAHFMGIIHRDLKPQNILLTKELEPKIVDFGIAYIEEGEDLTQEGKFVGSPKYVSPEQIMGLPLNAKSDIYSFGLLAYFVISGIEPFARKSSSEIIKAHLNETAPPFREELNVPKMLSKLIFACIEKKPENRPPSMKAISRVLEEME